jgi:phosphatidylethanolamine/phosphatidyl-N-methylethanolamine N-methyltransferase
MRDRIGTEWKDAVATARRKLRDEIEETADDLRRTVARARTKVVGARGKLEADAREARERLKFEVEQAASDIKEGVARARGRAKATRHRIEGEARVAAVKVKLRVAKVRTRADEVRRKAKKAAGRIEDEARFLRTWIESPLKTGAVSPSGPDLAREMARHVDPAHPGLVIELGPGTGPVTEALVARGVPEDRLLLVEYDAEFCRLLRKRFPRATVVQGDAYAIAQTLRGHVAARVAAVVSSLPLMTRPAKERLSLLRQSFALLAGGAPFVQFTYAAASPVPLAAGGFYAEPSKRIWRNIPPARVWVYRQA